MKYTLSNVVGDPFWLTTVPMALVGWAVALVGSIINSASDSAAFPVFSWWGIAFEMIAILMILHVAFSNRIRMYRLAILAFLSIATVYMTNNTNNFVWRNNSSSGAAAAGNILLSIINFVWILYFGTTQDEPVHMYIDSFALYKKTAPSNTDFQRRMREKRRRMMTGSAVDARSSQVPDPPRGGGPELGTRTHPYRMSDVPQNIEIGAPTGFNRQTDPSNPGGMVPGGAETTRTPSNPLSSTYLYSVDQLHRHGLDSHEVEPLENIQRYSMGSIMPANMEDPYANDAEDGYDTLYPIAKAKAKFSYEARLSDGEIPFVEGEILDVCDMTGNWWYCRRQNGEVGICPCNYLELLDEPLL